MNRTTLSDTELAAIEWLLDQAECFSKSELDKFNLARRLINDAFIIPAPSTNERK